MVISPGKEQAEKAHLIKTSLKGYFLVPCSFTQSRPDVHVLQGPEEAISASPATFSALWLEYHIFYDKLGVFFSFLLICHFDMHVENRTDSK